MNNPSLRDEDDDPDIAGLAVQSAAIYGQMFAAAPTDADPEAAEKAAKEAVFFASLKLGSTVRLKGDSMVTGEDYDRLAVVTDITDGKISFIVREKP